MDLLKKIKDLARTYEQENIEVRRYLHRHPELSTQEEQTSLYIASKLKEWGIEYRCGYSAYGIVAHIYGKNPQKRCIALRSDMDALPITEQTGLPFQSEHSGVMHACGHDVHMACLLGCAKILHQLREEFEGCVKLIFQPSEEDFRAGAKVMVAEGALENPRPDHIYALHVMPELECGKLGFKKGQYMASTDEIYLKVKGKAGHGATPELNVDSVLTAAYILTGLQQIVSRQAPPYIPTVLSFGKIIGEGRTNINPAEVNIEGTLRTFDETWRKSAHEKIRRTAEHIAWAMGAECEFVLDPGYPFVYNAETTTQRAMDIATEIVGKENVEDLPLRMIAEDFSFFAQEVDGCLFRLGTADAQRAGTRSNLHTDTLDVDERAIRIGVEMMCAVAIL